MIDVTAVTGLAGGKITALARRITDLCLKAELPVLVMEKMMG